MRLVIKLGTRVLTDSRGVLDTDNIFRFVSEAGELIDMGHEIIIVSSGAIGAGCGRMKCFPQNLSLREKQALSSIGQIDLMNSYREAFSRQNRIVGQILLTSQELSDRKSYLNIRNTILTLLKMKVIPIINENDTVAVEEIRFSDNDKISGIIASKVDADKLIILTDVDGLMDENGNIIKEVTAAEKVMKFAGPRKSAYGSGGMITKIDAAKTVSKLCGIDTYFACGRTAGVLKDIVSGRNPGTVFKGKESGVSHKKRWIGYGVSPSGSLTLDEGAVKAVVEKNTSLLPVGVRSVKGKFKAGDAVRCLDIKGSVVAAGLVNYSSAELKKIAGIKSSEIKNILGYKDFDEVIHRDNLVVMS